MRFQNLEVTYLFIITSFKIGKNSMQTAQKIKCSLGICSVNVSKSAGNVTEEIRNGKLHFCAVTIALNTAARPLDITHV